MFSLTYFVLRLDCLDVCRFLLNVGQDIECVPVARLCQGDHHRDRWQMAGRAAALNLRVWTRK